jgi:hypothetical protein
VKLFRNIGRAIKKPVKNLARSLGKTAKKFTNSELFTGSPAIVENVPTLLPEQIPVYQQLQNAAQGTPSAGAFGREADYYNQLLEPRGETPREMAAAAQQPNPEESWDYRALEAPALRQYYQNIVPGLSEQFASMGAGSSGLSGSGFRNAALQSGVDLAERLAKIRADLRQSGAEGLHRIGQTALTGYGNVMQTQPGAESLWSQLAPALGTASGAALGSYFGPAGVAAGSASGNWLGNLFNQNNTSSNKSPYEGGNNMASSPQLNQKLPTWMNR